MADTDQRKAHAQHLAQIVAAFYKELVAEGVPVDEAGWMAGQLAIALAKLQGSAP